MALCLALAPHDPDDRRLRKRQHAFFAKPLSAYPPPPPSPCTATRSGARRDGRDPRPRERKWPFWNVGRSSGWSYVAPVGLPSHQRSCRTWGGYTHEIVRRWHPNGLFWTSSAETFSQILVEPLLDPLKERLILPAIDCKPFTNLTVRVGYGCNYPDTQSRKHRLPGPNPPEQAARSVPGRHVADCAGRRVLRRRRARATHTLHRSKAPSTYYRAYIGCRTEMLYPPEGGGAKAASLTSYERAETTSRRPSIITQSTACLSAGPAASASLRARGPEAPEGLSSEVAVTAAARDRGGCATPGPCRAGGCGACSNGRASAASAHRRDNGSAWVEVYAVRAPQPQRGVYLEALPERTPLGSEQTDPSGQRRRSRPSSRASDSGSPKSLCLRDDGGTRTVTVAICRRRWGRWQRSSYAAVRMGRQKQSGRWRGCRRRCA
jgi:hypothetical protein